MITWATKQKGFTIVELLIVVVVIAILAAISIAAYNGIQTRAENTKTINSVAAYAKAIIAYGTDKGVYPVVSPAFPCLGTVSFCANTTDTSPGCDGAGRATNSSVLNNELAYLVSSLPEPSTQVMQCTSGSYATKQFSGAYYTYTLAGKAGEMKMYLRGDVATCPLPSGLTLVSRYQGGDTTACRMKLPDL